MKSTLIVMDVQRHTLLTQVAVIVSKLFNIEL